MVVIHYQENFWLNVLTNNVGIVRAILNKNNYFIDLKDKHGYTCLMMAAKKGFLGMVTALL